MWFDANKIRPDYDRDVIVAFEGNVGVYVAQWHKDHWVLCGHNEEAFQTITHWMDIPNHPIANV